MKHLMTAIVLLVTASAGVAIWGGGILGSSNSGQALAALAENSGTWASPTGDQKAQAMSRPFAFVELFTSEGCSSCPSADENLQRIANKAAAAGQDVYTLSYHVDYWDYLGWKDPYSKSQFSDRQRSYAKQFKSTRIYTPQMVVNGKAEFVGSKKSVSDRAVDLALAAKATSSISLTAAMDSGKLNVNWKANGIGADEVVNVALVQNSGSQKVSRGENARRNLSHVNIVRQLKTVSSPGTEGTLQFTVGEDFSKDNYHVVAFTQSNSAVTSAAKSTIANKVTVRKPPMGEQSSNRALVGERRFLEILSGDALKIKSSLELARDNWDPSYVSMLLDVARFLPTRERSQVMGLVESKTGQSFGRDFDKWLQWNWKQDFKPHPGYGKFKSTLYRSIDPRFAEYFTEADKTIIRLDEIRWGGVRRDGIPPLKDPKMLAAKDANYLGDSDVVFGIELNGDARAYPKRILAWHEMFKDTIGGESVCGVY